MAARSCTFSLRTGVLTSTRFGHQPAFPITIITKHPQHPTSLGWKASLSTLAMDATCRATEEGKEKQKHAEWRKQIIPWLGGGMVVLAGWWLMRESEDNSWRRMAWAAEPEPTIAAEPQQESIDWDATIAGLDALYDSSSGTDSFVATLRLLEQRLTIELPVPQSQREQGRLAARLARVLANLADEQSDQEAKKKLVYQAYELAKQGVSWAADDWFAQKWMAITISKTGDYESPRRQVEDASLIREHLEAALALNPNDPTSHHILGVWFFSLADMGWMKRQLVSVVFATPPNATYQEALSCFLKAEQLSPRFYLKNVYYLAKTCAALHQLDDARKWKQIGLTMPVTNADDREAALLLSQLSF